MTDRPALPTPPFDWDSGEDAFPREHAPLVADSRTEARICTVQVLYSAQLRRMDVREVMGELTPARLKKRKADKHVFTALAAEAGEGAARYATMIQAELREDWSWDRLDLVLRSILWAAAAELTVSPSLPVAVIVDEYVNITKGFLTAEQAGFAHGVIDRLAVKIRG
jgi:N utilization substance protein B